jgi:hypothetical protein
MPRELPMRMMRVFVATVITVWLDMSCVTSVAQFNETDTVDVRLVQPDRVLVERVDGGFTHDASPRHALSKG